MLFGEHKDDIKTFFDFLRNLGLCLVILLGIPQIKAARLTLFEAFYLKELLMGLTFLLFLSLYVLNIAWLFQNLKNKSRPKIKNSSFMIALFMSVLLSLLIYELNMVYIISVLSY